MIQIDQQMIDLAAQVTADGGDQRKVAEKLGVSRATIQKWLAGNEEFSRAHCKAKMAYAESLVESLMVEAKLPLPDDPKMANAEIQRRRLCADNIKWIACKLIPKTYGDKIDVSGEVVHTLSPLAQLRQLETRTAPTPPVIEPVMVEAEVVEAEIVEAEIVDDCI